MGWRISRDRRGDLVLTGAGEEAPPRGEAINGFLAVAEIERRSASPWEADPPHPRQLHDPRDALRAALVGGVLQAYRRPREDVAKRVRQPVEPAAGDKRVEEASWIAIELVDMEDNPVGGERYQLTLPDGTVVVGTTSSKGAVRVPSADPGACKLVFLDLDREAWEEA